MVVTLVTDDNMAWVKSCVGDKVLLCYDNVALKTTRYLIGAFQITA